MPSEPFYLDPDYVDFIPGKTPLKFKTMGKTNVFGCLTGLVVLGFGACSLVLWIMMLEAQIRGEAIEWWSFLLYTGIGLFLPFSGIRMMRQFILEQQRYNRLRLESEVREGILIDVQWKQSKGSLALPLDLEIEYAFSTPKGVRLRRKQRRYRPDLFDKPLPAYGTPVRVLYADDDAVVML